MIDPLKRPERPGQPKPNTSATQRPETTKQKKVIDTPNRSSSGGGKNRDGRRGYGGGLPPEGQPNETSPWLIQPEFELDETASFVEYLRWMRSPDGPYENSAKVQIMQMAEHEGNYKERLNELTTRTIKIAQARRGITFQAKCPWRIRVGGHRGPNKGTLLPAFDATGMPYIPSSTLRGVARTQAILEKLPRDIDRSNEATFKEIWKQAELEVAEWFGHLKSKESENRSGKVIFLDAYPLPDLSGLLGGLAMDMANNIWTWKSNGMPPEYKPNPNALFSLKGAVFQIGLCPMSNSEEDVAACNQVREWLVSGLQSGIGSQVNTGYGRLLVENIEPNNSQEILQVHFSLKGQLIHGRQAFSDLERPYKWDHYTNDYKVKGKNQEFEADTVPDPEVRPTAFKSILRYWFRTLSLGVLPVKDVEEVWEPRLFGAIQPQTRGWVEFEVEDVSNPVTQVQEKGEPCLEQSGSLKLSYSLAAPQSEERRTLVRKLFEHLTWLMFHLGGIGQGARRPLYCREDRQNPRPPWYRGTDLKATENDLFQEYSSEVSDFCANFQSHLQGFYQVLSELSEQPIKIPQAQPQLSNRPIQKKRWRDVVDADCEIIVCAGSDQNGKPFALAVLHCDDLKIPKMKNGKKVLERGREVLTYNPDLCGKAGDRSPVWIKNLGEYQIVTVFGATQNPRKQYLDELKRQAHGNYVQIFPFT